MFKLVELNEKTGLYQLIDENKRRIYVGNIDLKQGLNSGRLLVEDLAVIGDEIIIVKDSAELQQIKKEYDKRIEEERIKQENKVKQEEQKRIEAELKLKEEQEKENELRRKIEEQKERDEIEKARIAWEKEKAELANKERKIIESILSENYILGTLYEQDKFKGYNVIIDGSQDIVDRKTLRKLIYDDNIVFKNVDISNGRIKIIEDKIYLLKQLGYITKVIKDYTEASHYDVLCIITNGDIANMIEISLKHSNLSKYKNTRKLFSSARPTYLDGGKLCKGEKLNIYRYYYRIDKCATVSLIDSPYYDSTLDIYVK